MATLARAPLFMQKYLRDATLDDGLPAPELSLPPTAWGTAASYAGRDMFMSETTLDSFIEGPSGLSTDSTFLEQQPEKATTEFTSASSISAHYPLYYFEVTVHALRMVDAKIMPGIAYQHGQSAMVDLGHYDIRSARVLSTYTCKNGDVIGCGVCPKENMVFFAKNGLYLGRRIVDLRAVTSLRPLLAITVGSTPVPLRIRTRANFGQEPFAFNVCSWYEPLWKARMEKFRQTAACLPAEVLTTVAAFAAEGSVTTASQAWHSCGDSSPWLLRRHMVIQCRLSMVCRAWRKICRSPLFSTLCLLRTTHLYQIRGIFDHYSGQAHPGRFVETVYVGPNEASPVNAHDDSAPAMELVLSSGLLRQSDHVRKIVWDEHDPSRPVPPRVQAALPSLLRASFQGLTELCIRNRTLSSFNELFRIVSTVHTLRIVHLEHLRCAPRMGPAIRQSKGALSSLQELVVKGCIFSLEQVSALSQVCLIGRALNHGSEVEKPCDAYSERPAIDATDASNVISIAEALLGSYYRSDVEHYCQDISLRTKRIDEVHTGNVRWELSLLDRVPTSWVTKEPHREVLHLSTTFRTHNDSPYATADKVSIEFYNCYKPRPVTHWPAFESMVRTLDGLVAGLPHRTEFGLRARDYSTWEEPWLPALENVTSVLRDRVRRWMPQAREKGVVRVEHLGTMKDKCSPGMQSSLVLSRQSHDDKPTRSAPAL